MKCQHAVRFVEEQTHVHLEVKASRAQSPHRRLREVKSSHFELRQGSPLDGGIPEAPRRISQAIEICKKQGSQSNSSVRQLSQYKRKSPKSRKKSPPPAASQICRCLPSRVHWPLNEALSKQEKALQPLPPITNPRSASERHKKECQRKREAITTSGAFA